MRRAPTLSVRSWNGPAPRVRDAPAAPRTVWGRAAHGGVLTHVVCVTLLLAALAAPAPATAQAATGRAFLPGATYFRALLADPLEPRFAVSLTHSDILARRGPERPPFAVSDSAAAVREFQAHAAMGATIPLVRLGTWPGGGWALVGQAAAFARFRIERSSRDHLAEDWIVGGGAEARWGDISMRAHIRHQSSHLGDEFMGWTGAERIEYGGEQFDLLLAQDYGEGAWRIYYGGSWIFRSYTEDTAILQTLERGDRFQFQAGFDGAWPMGADTRHTLVAGVDVRMAERTAYKRQLAAVGGWRFVTAHGDLGFQLRYHDGPSFQGEFFLTQERAWMLELVLTSF